jgi:hypothetical protein
MRPTTLTYLIKIKMIAFKGYQLGHKLIYQIYVVDENIKKHDIFVAL